jgi:cell volume regulation protein A
MFLIDTLILLAGVLVLLGIGSSKLSTRLGLPVLVLFLLLGMLAGSEGIGGIDFEDHELAHAIGTLALVMILFDGGLSTSAAAIREVWKPSLVLATLGVLVTSLVTGAAAAWILKIPLLEGLLLGSIVGSTDAAAVFSMLRAGGVSLSRRIASVLEIESASNDPMAIFLTIGCIELLAGRVEPGPGLLGLFASQMLIGSVFGVLGGLAAVWVINRIELGAAGLYPVLINAFCLLTYGVAVWFGGSGFLAVFLAGVVIGNRRPVFHRGILLFHDAIAWLSQIIMFVVLGLLCFPSRLLNVAGPALLISLVLIFLARPIAVLVSTLPFRFSPRELVFTSWVGLKGAVPITLATFPLMFGTPRAALLFDVVFFVVVISAVVQGSTLAGAARWLGLERPRAPEPPVTLEISSLRHVDGEIVDYHIGEDSRAAGRLVRELALPEGVVIALIARGHQVIPPQGNTRIHAGDHVILVLRAETQPLVNQIFRRTDARGEIPLALEFPLRASTTVGAIEDLYGIPVEEGPDVTLAAAVQTRLDGRPPAADEIVRIGPLLLRILSVSSSGTLEMVGMSVLTGEPVTPPDEGPQAERVAGPTGENALTAKGALTPMKLLAALDGSDSTEVILAELARRPWPPGSELELVTAVAPIDPNLLRGGSTTVTDEIVSRERNAALQRLKAAASRLEQQAPGLRVTYRLLDGPPKDVIVGEAERWGADLILVGSHGYGPVKRFFLGSVSLAVAMNAHCSVEIVRGAPAAFASG